MTPDEFNERFPIGTEVIWLPSRADIEAPLPGVTTKTRSTAWELGGHTVVAVEYRSGGVAIDHLVVLDPEYAKEWGLKA